VAGIASTHRKGRNTRLPFITSRVGEKRRESERPHRNATNGGTVDAQELRTRLMKSLLNKIEETSFPNTELLNRVEASLATRDELAEYGEILVKKVEGTQFPSAELLGRVETVVSELAAAERG
jgi:hypothetical protein